MLYDELCVPKTNISAIWFNEAIFLKMLTSKMGSGLLKLFYINQHFLSL